MLKNLKWYESIMLTLVMLIGAWTLTNYIIELYSSFEIIRMHSKYNIKAQVYILMILNLIILTNIYFYLNTKRIAWIIFFLALCLNIYFNYFTVKIILYTSNSIVQYMLLDGTFSEYFKIFGIPALSIFYSLFATIILLLPNIRLKFQINWRQIIIYTFIVLSIILMHYSLSPQETNINYGVWGAPY